MIIGVTGKIHSGKSTLLKNFEGKYKIVYADQLSKLAFQLKQKTILTEFGTTDRNEISDIVFNSKYRLRKLEFILHPVMNLLLNKIHEKYGFIIFEMANLYSSHFYLSCDKTIVVTSPEEERSKWLKNSEIRNIKKIDELQISVKELKELADYSLRHDSVEKMRKILEQNYNRYEKYNKK